MSELVSVALCTYNGGKFLKKQLQSICDQTYKNVEIVVVDDGSTDHTLSVISEFTGKANIRLFRNDSNLGFIKNFEKAVSLCSGAYIALSDQDDIWLPEKIETLVKSSENTILTYSDAELIDHEDRPLHTSVSDLVNPVTLSNPLPLLINNCAPGNTLFFRKELLQYACPFPEKIFHDWWLLYVAACVGTISYVATPLVRYRQHGENITNMNHHRKDVPKETKSQRMERMLYSLRQFQSFNHRHGVRNETLDKFIALLGNKSKNFIDLKLFRFLYQHRDDLFYVLKKSTFKKNHRILKMAMP
jgi:glycosyltransferase involved in cell wall biosynthesis